MGTYIYAREICARNLEASATAQKILTEAVERGVSRSVASSTLLYGINHSDTSWRALARYLPYEGLVTDRSKLDEYAKALLEELEPIRYPADPKQPYF